MNSLLIYSPNTSPRLKYVLDWLFTEQLGLAYTLTTDASLSANISYGSAKIGSIHIPDAGLLWQHDVQVHNIPTGTWHGIPTFYHKGEGNASVPFDIFSAIFFLLTRYEEYGSFTPDKHGRYPASQSVLFNFLERPVIDEWIAEFAKLLLQKNIPVQQKQFSYTPTYDIDIAWSYKNKGLQRNAGGLAKDILKGNFADAAQRLSALSGSEDPYDSFEVMDVLHKEYNVSPIYFMLVAERTSEFDKNISPENPAMQALIKSLSGKYTLGIHPSYNSSSHPSLIADEKNVLQKITGKLVTQSRQHYIKFKLPDTYRELVSANITDDHSMGYATHLGFRAGTGCSFFWYDIKAEAVSPLRVHPFCFMDTTARYDMSLSVTESFERLNKMRAVLLATKSTLVTIFHNFSLGSDATWAGWKEAYSNFLHEMQ